MKLSRARRVAEKAGYATAATADDKSLRTWLVENVECDDDAGKAIDFNTEPLEAEDAAPKAEPEPTKGAKKKITLDPELPDDFGARVQALVNDQVRAALKNVKIPGMPVVGNDPVQVRTVEEVVYEDQCKRGRTFFRDVNQAIGCRRWLSALMCSSDRDPRPDMNKARKPTAEKWAKWQEHNNVAKSLATSSVTGGASLVPEGFVPDLIRNVLERGVARVLARVLPMSEQAMTIPARTGGITGTYPLENAAATESSPTYDNIQLSAHTFVVNTRASNQIIQDSGLALMDIVMEEIAYCIAQQEDDILLIGNSTPTYAGITGFEFKYGVTATDGGYVVVGGADATAHTAAQVDAAIARVPQYARRGMVITCSPTIKATIFDRLATSTPGGLTLKELTGMGMVSQWKGIPIIENNSMSAITDAAATSRAGFTAGDQIDFLIGNFQRAAIFGERLGMELAVSDQRGFLEYATWLRGVVRHDVNVHNRHDTGEASSTKAGPVVSFWQT